MGARLGLNLDRPDGVSWYVGAPMSGKTTLACVHARAWSEALARPIVVVDSAGTRDFERLPHVETVHELVRRVWGEGESVAITPTDRSEVESLARAVRRGGDVVLLVDEAHYWLGGRSGHLLALMRATQHARARVLATTQHPSGDIPQAAWACDPDLYAFRLTSPRSLELLEREFGLDPRELRSLPPHYYLRS